MFVTTHQHQEGRSEKEMDEETYNAIVSLLLFSHLHINLLFSIIQIYSLLLDQASRFH